MAGPCTRRNIGGVPTNNSNTPKPIFAVSYALIFVPVHASALTLVLAFASILSLLNKYTDEDLQRATKLALQLFVKNQKHGQLQTRSASCQ